MKNINLVFIVFSDLNSSSGGVETWLKLFLEEIRLRKEHYPIRTIHIYYYEKSHVENLIGHDVEFVRHHPFKISSKKNGLLGNLITLFKFHLFSIKDLQHNKVNAPFVISIGSYPSGIFNWGILKLLRYRRSIMHVVWLRTTLKKYIKTHKSKVFSRLILYLEQHSLRDADIIISNGWDTRDNYLSDYNINSHVIPNAIKLNKYLDFDSLSSLQFPIEIAFIGRFFENKGVFNFIEAISIFNEKYIDLIDKVKFVFIGWGEDSIKTFAINTRNCEFIGKVANEKMEFYLNKIFCGVALTKFNDDEAGGSGVSNGLLELMGAGRAIIAFDNPIFRQFPEADFMIYSIENNNLELAEKFANLIQNKDAFIINGENAKRYAQSFSISAHVATFFKLLNEKIK